MESEYLLFVHNVKRKIGSLRAAPIVRSAIEIAMLFTGERIPIFIRPIHLMIRLYTRKPLLLEKLLDATGPKEELVVKVFIGKAVGATPMIGKGVIT